MKTKKWYESSTIWGIAVAALSIALQRLGYTVDTAGLTMDIVAAVGLAMAARGRFVATAPISTGDVASKVFDVFKRTK